MENFDIFPNSMIEISRVLGLKVMNKRSVYLGNIKEVLMDYKIKKIAYVILASGGFLGIGKRFFPLPFFILSYNTDRNVYVIDISEEKLKKAPEFESENGLVMCDKNWHYTLANFYECPPYWK